mmetsp:Transcript_67041/g.151542  ORF Transcript_67041/g.151542 Transcript_67041/m.151542 type:complete len:229 (+) Transcript_67041:1202-1888(+)
MRGLGLMQRMKLHLVSPSSSVNRRIDLTKPIDTVVLFTELFFEGPPPVCQVAALAASASNKRCTRPKCAAPNTSVMDSGRGSLFLRSQPPTVYCTGPAKCKTLNESSASRLCTSGKKSLVLWSLVRSRTNLGSDGWMAAHCTLSMSRIPRFPASSSTAGLLSGQFSRAHKIFSSLKSRSSASNTCLLNTFWRYSLAKLMSSCSRPFTLKDSNPKMSSTPMKGSGSPLL